MLADSCCLKEHPYPPTPSAPLPGIRPLFHNPASERLMPDHAGTTRLSTIYSAGLSPRWTAGEIHCIHPAPPCGTHFALFPPSMLALPLLCLFRYLSFFQDPMHQTPPVHLTTVYQGSEMDIMAQNALLGPRGA